MPRRKQVTGNLCLNTCGVTDRAMRARLATSLDQPLDLPFAGLEALRLGMALGSEGGYVNSFIWQPNIMARLCVRALEAGIEVEYVRGTDKIRLD